MTFFVSFRHQADGKGTRAKGKREEVLERWGEARLKRRAASKLMETKSVKNTGGSTAASKQRRPAGNFGSAEEMEGAAPPRRF